MKGAPSTVVALAAALLAAKLVAAAASAGEEEPISSGEKSEQGRLQRYLAGRLGWDGILLTAVVVVAAASALFPSMLVKLFTCGGMCCQTDEQEAEALRKNAVRAYRASLPKRGYNLEEIKRCDGTDASIDPELANPEIGDDGRRLYLSCKGIVFDVTSNMSAYGPGKGYHVLTHCDASIPLARHNFDISDELQTREAWEEQSRDGGGSGADEWIKYFLRKYEPVGWLTEGCVPRKGMPSLEAPYEGNEADPGVTSVEASVTSDVPTEEDEAGASHDSAEASGPEGASSVEDEESISPLQPQTKDKDEDEDKAKAKAGEGNTITATDDATHDAKVDGAMADPQLAATAGTVRGSTAASGGPVKRRSGGGSGAGGARRRQKRSAVEE